MTDAARPPRTVGGPTVRWLVLAVAVAVVAIVAAVVMLRGHHHAKKAQPLVLPKAAPQLDTGGLELASLLTAGQRATYHARYTSTSNPTVSGGVVTLEAWNTPGKSRADTTLKTPDGKLVRTASILNAGKAVACQQPPGAGWSCHSVAPPAEGDPAGLVGSVTAKLSGRQVIGSSATVGGHQARCFHVTGVTEPFDVCASHDGVLLRVSSAEAKIEIAKLDSSVPGNAFDPPAKPTG